jgi:hypothetical protein
MGMEIGIGIGMVGGRARHRPRLYGMIDFRWLVWFRFDSQAVIWFGIQLAISQLMGLPCLVALAAPSELLDGILERKLVRQLFDTQVAPQLVVAEFILVCEKRLSIYAAFAEFCFKGGGIG